MYGTKSVPINKEYYGKEGKTRIILEVLQRS